MARGLKVDLERQSEREGLRMADGSIVKTEGRVRILLKCGAYHGMVEATVFPGLDKPIILGIP